MKPNNNDDDVQILQNVLIEKLKSEGHIRSSHIETAFRAVPRHRFLPEVALDEVYTNQAIITKRENGIPSSSSSQPSLMATMLENLDLKPGHRVLEIGTGTGYNAALMANIVGNQGKVVTVEIDEDIVAYAHKHLLEFGYDQVQLICGDGGLGYPQSAPYDRVILTVGAWDITPAWLEQLKPTGRLIVPLWFKGEQLCLTFERVDGHLGSIAIGNVGFMRLRGEFAGPETFLPVVEGGELQLAVDNKQISIDNIIPLLAGPSRDYPTGVEVFSYEVWKGLALWLALQETNFTGLIAEGGMAKKNMIPFLFGQPGKRLATGGLLEHDNLALLMRPPDYASLLTDTKQDRPPFEVFIRGFGENESLAHYLADQVIAWDRVGRPSSENLSVQAYPIDTDYSPKPGETVIKKRWMKYVFNW